MTDEELETLLNKQYSKSFLIEHGYDANIKLTRRENGENEYRKEQWLDSIHSAGFNVKILELFTLKLISNNFIGTF